jgi:hypothetical protein
MAMQVSGFKMSRSASSRWFSSDMIRSRTSLSSQLTRSVITSPSRDTRMAFSTIVIPDQLKAFSALVFPAQGRQARRSQRLAFHAWRTA